MSLSSRLWLKCEVNLRAHEQPTQHLPVYKRDQNPTLIPACVLGGQVTTRYSAATYCVMRPVGTSHSENICGRKEHRLRGLDLLGCVSSVAAGCHHCAARGSFREIVCTKKSPHVHFKAFPRNIPDDQAKRVRFRGVLLRDLSQKECRGTRTCGVQCMA